MLRVWLKFAVGLVLMGGGFMLLALNAHQARLDGQASMGMMIAGLALMGFAGCLLIRSRWRKLPASTCPASRAC